MKQRMKVSDKNTQIGIDIGTEKICCAITEINSDEKSNKILGVGSVPSQGIKKGSIVHRDRVMDAIESAVREAELMAGIKVNRAMLSISGDHIRGINTQGAIAIQKGNARNVPVVEQEITQNDVSRVLELAKAVSLPVDREILHILPQEYLIEIPKIYLGNTQGIPMESTQYAPGHLQNTREISQRIYPQMCSKSILNITKIAPKSTQK